MPGAGQFPINRPGLLWNFDRVRSPDTTQWYSSWNLHGPNNMLIISVIRLKNLNALKRRRLYFVMRELAHMKYFTGLILRYGEVGAVHGIFFPFQLFGHSEIFNAPGKYFIPFAEAWGGTGNGHPAAGHIQNARLSAGILLMSPFQLKVFFRFL